AAGQSDSKITYTYSHKEPNPGINFYRIVQNDLDGKRSVSKDLRVQMDQTEAVWSIYPNPVTNGSISLQLSKPVLMHLYNNSGKLIWKKQVQAGASQINVGNLGKGLYLLQGGGHTQWVMIQ